MRYMLTVDLEDDADIDSFLAFVRFHAARFGCPTKDVFVKLSQEFMKEMKKPLKVEETKDVRKGKGRSA